MSRFHQFTRLPLHHYVFSPMCHSAISRFRHRTTVTIARSHHSTTIIPTINHSANPPFGHSIIPTLVLTSAFHRSAILPHHHLASPTHLIVQPFRHSSILSFRHLVFSHSLFCHFTIRPFLISYHFANPILLTNHPTNSLFRNFSVSSPNLYYAITLFRDSVVPACAYCAMPPFQHSAFPLCTVPSSTTSTLIISIFVC